MNTDGDFSMPMRQPPASVEAEQALIGSCLLDPFVIDEAAAQVEPGDFFRAAHVELWRHLLKIRESGRDVDAVTLADSLGPSLAKLGGMDLLESIMSRTPHSANGLYFAGIVRAKAKLRRMIEASNETLRECYAAEDTPDAICERAEQRVLGVGDKDGQDGATEIGAVVVESMVSIESRGRGDRRGIMTGFEDVDSLTDGMKPQDFVIVAARPSMGKTAFAAAVAVNASTSGTPTLFASLEMSRHSIGERLLSSTAKVDAERLKRPWLLKPADRAGLGDAMVRLGAAAMEIVDSPYQTVSKIAASARRMRARRGLGLVVIDYLSLIDGQRQRGENRQEEVARMSRRLKAMARELNCPVICLHQLNRQSEQREGHRPRLSDLRESGQVEQDADMVILLHRPEYYDPNDSPGVAEVIVAKNRNGPTGAARLTFTRNCTRFDSQSVASQQEAEF
jgi:replicative DNA helicase